MSITLKIFKEPDKLKEVLAIKDMTLLSEEQKELLKPEISLTDFTIVNYKKAFEDIEGKNEFLSRNIIGIDLFGKYGLFDKSKESEEVNKLSVWSKFTAHEEEAYKRVEINLIDSIGNMYETIIFEKAFLISYYENQNKKKGFLDYYAFIRKIDDTESAIKI